MAVKKFKGTKTTVLIIVMVFLVAGYYLYLTNRNRATSEETAISDVQDVLLRDLMIQYPPTPKEVVKFYSRLTECFYNANYTEEEFDQLATKARELYDQELLDDNPMEENFMKLDEEVDDFRKQKQTISSYSVSPSTDVEYWTQDNREMASLYCVYVLNNGKTAKSVNEQFLLRKDDDGHWKILGWKAVNLGRRTAGRSDSGQEEGVDGAEDGGTNGDTKDGTNGE